MSEHPVTVLIAVKSNSLRTGLRSLLETILQAGVVGETTDPESLPALVAGQRPELVLLDGKLWSEARWLLLGDVRVRSPHTRWVVLAETESQQEQASQAGVDAAILQGLSPPQLLLLIQQLLGKTADHATFRSSANSA